MVPPGKGSDRSMVNLLRITDSTNLSVVITAHAGKKACRRHPSGSGVPNAYSKESKALPILRGPSGLVVPPPCGGPLNVLKSHCALKFTTRGSPG